MPTTFEKLNLPELNYKLKQKDEQYEIFDLIRKKYVLLTPEEWVRQHFVNYLINHQHYPKSMIQVEREIIYNNLSKRFDVVVYDQMGEPFMLVECKAASVKLSQETFAQAATYNLNLKSNYLVISNGKQHFCCKIEHKLKKYDFVSQLPAYPKANG